MEGLSIVHRGSIRGHRASVVSMEGPWWVRDESVMDPWWAHDASMTRWRVRDGSITPWWVHG